MNNKSIRMLLILLCVLAFMDMARTQTYEYLPGDVNMYNGNWPPETISGDVTYLVNYFRSLPASNSCRLNGFWASADINSDCIITSSDVTRLVNYFRGLNSVGYCQTHAPAWLSVEDLPELAPPGWPNCDDEIDYPPVISPIPSQDVTAGNHLEFRVTASDPNDDTIYLSAELLPDNASFFDSTNGIGGFTFDPDYDQVGNYQIRIIAGAGTLADTGLVTIVVSDTATQGFIFNHVYTEQWENIPDPVIAQIVNENRIYYVHTSHGSQIVSGLTEVNEADSRFPDLNYDPYQIITNIGDDLGADGDTSWAAPTRTYLNSHPECSMVMYSWCGGVSGNSEQGINIYLNKMNELESQFPDIVFIYMTGHLDGSGPTGNLYLRNNQIRQYCIINSKVLFDFADIESWDPDGNYYPDDTDACYWCSDWCANPEHDCDLDCNCAHSHCFNCFQKGKTWWVMMAYLEGWSAD